MSSVSDSEFHVLHLTSSNFRAATEEPGRSALVMLYKPSGCERCRSLAVYFKRVALRFWEMGLSGRVQACRMEVTPELGRLMPGVEVGSLPVVVLLGGGEEPGPPYMYYTGVGKPQPLMKWVEENAEGVGPLGELPHLNDEEKGRYKEQIVARERRREEIERERGIAGGGGVEEL